MPEDLVEDYTHLKQTIARNIAERRKALGLTQAELAEKLNYSDKAVSKWERAEAVPDVFILKQLAGIFGVTLDELTSTLLKKVFLNLKTKKVLIPVIAAACVWIVASAVYFALSIAGVSEKLWLSFIYAIPTSLLVLLVFNCIWGKPVFTCIATSLLIWTAALSVFLSLQVDKMSLVFMVAAPLQVVVVLWYFLFRKQRPAE